MISEKRLPKKILILVWAETSAYNATFRLARVLNQRGYEIVYAVPDRWKEHIKQQGYQTICFDVSENLSPAPTAWWRHIIIDRDEVNKQLKHLCESLAWVESEGFALVLLYPTLWHYALVLHRFAIPYITINPSLASV